MKIYIMRHGEAGHFAASDAERELTDNGLNQSISVATAGAKEGMQDIDVTLVSPYIRAQQTWNGIKEFVNAKKVEECEDITPYGQSDDVYHLIIAKAKTEQLDSVLLVSHLPLVGYLTSEFVKGMPAPMFPTSGLVCVNFDLDTEQGEIAWHIHP